MNTVTLDKSEYDELVEHKRNNGRIEFILDGKDYFEVYWDTKDDVIERVMGEVDKKLKRANIMVKVSTSLSVFFIGMAIVATLLYYFK